MIPWFSAEAIREREAGAEVEHRLRSRGIDPERPSAVLWFLMLTKDRKTHRALGRWERARVNAEAEAARWSGGSVTNADG